MNKFKQWELKVQDFINGDNYRLGQAYVNALAYVDFSLYKEISYTDCDCFYRDELCESFLNEIKKRWNV